MAKPKAKAATSYDDAAQYLVRLAVPVTIGSFKYLPRQNPTMRGTLLNEIVKEHGQDAIGTAVRC